MQPISIGSIPVIVSIRENELHPHEGAKRSDERSESYKEMEANCWLSIDVQIIVMLQ